MNDTIQQALVALAVLGAALFLILRGRTKKGGGKSGGCGCGKKKPPLS